MCFTEKWGFSGLVTFLIDEGVGPHPNAMRALLRCCAAPDATRAADGWTALHVAAAAGHGGECARTLLEAGARLVPDEMGRLPDECAATLGAPPPNRDAPQKSKP